MHVFLLWYHQINTHLAWRLWILCTCTHTIYNAASSSVCLPIPLCLVDSPLYSRSCCRIHITLFPTATSCICSKLKLIICTLYDHSHYVCWRFILSVCYIVGGWSQCSYGSYKYNQTQRVLSHSPQLMSGTRVRCWWRTESSSAEVQGQYSTRCSGWLGYTNS